MSKMHWIVLAALTMPPATLLAASPVARLTAPRTTCAAPCAIFFDARATTDADSGDLADNLLDLIYTWDFGDPGSGVWDQGARAEVSSVPHSKNFDTGFIAGHVYDVPGTYRATVTVSDGTSTSTASLDVTIQDPGQVWSGNRTVCIANGSTPSAGSGGCPSGARVANMSDFSAAISTHGCDDSSMRCLFRRGDSFSRGSPIRMRSHGPTLIGAYGSGPKPRVNAPPGAGIFQFDDSEDTRIVDLQLVGANTEAGVALNIGPGPSHMRQVLALRVDISRFDTQVFIHGQAQAYEPGVNVPTEIAIVDSSMLDGPGLGGLDAFLMWEKSLFMGNRLGDKFDGDNGRGEHILRAKFSHGVVYAHNSLGLLNNTGGRIGCGTIRHVMKLVSGLANDYYPAGVSREHITIDNYFSACKNNAWDLDVGRTDSQPEKIDEGQRRFIVERNYFTRRFNERGNGKSMQVEGDEGAVRNNILELSADSDGIRVWNRAPLPPTVPTRHIRVYNNSCYRPSGPGDSRCVELTSDSSDARVRNNVLYDPDGNSVVLLDGGVRTATCGSCNFATRTTPYISSAPSQLSHFAPRAGGPMLDGGDTVPAIPINVTGRVVPLDGDDDGVARFDIGAWEADGQEGEIPPPPPPSAPPPVDPPPPAAQAPAAPLMLP